MFINRLIAFFSLTDMGNFQMYNSVFIENFTLKIEKWHPLYIEELFDVLESINELDFLENLEIVDILVESISARLSKFDFNLGTPGLVRSLNSFSGFHTKNISFYEQLFSNIGKFYLKFTDDQKVEVLTALGKRGFSNKAIFEIIVKDLSNPSKDLRDDHSIAIMSSLCQVNLENEPYATRAFSQILTSLNVTALAENLLADLGFVLAKKNDTAQIEKYFSHFFIPPFTIFPSVKKRLILYYYFEMIGKPFGSEKDFEFLKKITDFYQMWGESPERLERVKERIEKNGLKCEVVQEISGIVVPLAVQELNAAVILRNKWITTFDEQELKGEYALLVDILQRKGVQVFVFPQDESDFFLLSKLKL